MFKHWKNITIYKLSREADLTHLEDKKKMILFTPCGSQDMAKFGFVSPFGDNSEVIAMHGNGFILVEAKRETKILPPPVIQRAIQEKIEKLEQEQARKLKKTEKDSLKDQVLHSLLPRAFSKFSVIQAIYDGSTKRIYINASARQAEDMLALMRKSLGSLPVVPLSVENPIELTLTDWVRDASAPQGFQMGDAAELKAVLEDGGIARVKKQDLGSDEISTHLEAGKLVTKLALDWQNRIKFTLDHNFSLTSVKFADELLEQNSDIDSEDVAQRLDADFFLLTSEISCLVDALVNALGGQVIHISPNSKDYINPMDINMDYSDDDNPLGVKSDFILSLCELIMGSRNGIEAEEKSVIDRCLPLVYQKYFENPVPENMPVLGDLYNCLRSQKEPQAQRIATALEIYVNGSLKVFNHRTNVQLDNRIVCFDIKDLGKQLKKLGMLIVQDQVWNRVTINRSSHKSTRYYMDEFHLLLKEEQTAAYSVEIFKRFRKWGGIPTGITQNIKDLLASREIENIFENSDFILMLNQAAGDRQILAKQLNISPYQLSYVTNSGEGEGLLFYGNIIIPFKDKFDRRLKLYSLMTSKPSEMAENDRKGSKQEG